MYTEIETENVMCNFVKKIFLEMWLLCFSIAKKNHLKKCILSRKNENI